MNPSTGKIEQTYEAFLPPPGMSRVPVTVDPTGHWLAASNGAGKVDMLAINQRDAFRTRHQVFNVDASSVAFAHTGKFLYAAQNDKKCCSPRLILIPGPEPLNCQH